MDGARRQPIRQSSLDGLRDAVNKAFELGRELHGGDFTAGAGPDEICGCGEEITWYEGQWLHVANPELRGTGDHDAEPGGGYYKPEDDGGTLTAGPGDWTEETQR